MTDELLSALLAEVKRLRADLRRMRPDLWPPAEKGKSGAVVESVPPQLSHGERRSMRVMERK